jgi:hypothetical protein
MGFPNELDRYFRLHALSTLGEMVIGHRANGDVVLVEDAGGFGRERLLSRLASLTGIDRSDLDRLDAFPVGSLPIPRSDSLASDRMIAWIQPGSAPWFARLALSEALVDTPPISKSSLTRLDHMPRRADPESGLGARPAPRRTRRATGPPPASDLRLSPPPAPTPGAKQIQLGFSPATVVSSAPAASPHVDPDWTRLSHPEMTHLLAGLPRTRTLPSLRPWLEKAFAAALMGAGCLAFGYLVYRLARWLIGDANLTVSLGPAAGAALFHALLP